MQSHIFNGKDARNKAGGKNHFLIEISWFKTETVMFTVCQFENEALDEMNDGKFKKKKRVWGQITSSWFKMEV